VTVVFLFFVWEFLCGFFFLWGFGGVFSSHNFSFFGLFVLGDGCFFFYCLISTGGGSLLNRFSQELTEFCLG